VLFFAPKLLEPLTAAVTAPVSIRLIAIQKQAIAVHQWAVYGHLFAR
jgi:hypothetical protein